MIKKMKKIISILSLSLIIFIFSFFFPSLVNSQPSCTISCETNCKQEERVTININKPEFTDSQICIRTLSPDGVVMARTSQLDENGSDTYSIGPFSEGDYEWCAHKRTLGQFCTPEGLGPEQRRERYYEYCNRDPVCNGTFSIGANASPPPQPEASGEGKQITLLEPECCSGAQVCDEYDEWGGCIKEHCSHIETALGCFPTQPRGIIEWLLKYAIMFAGGLGFLLMLFASFQIMTSSGDPDKLQAGQQLLGSAIAGILFIVFALFLLRFIGFTILQIPGWQ